MTFKRAYVCITSHTFLITNMTPNDITTPDYVILIRKLKCLCKKKKKVLFH